MFKVSGGFYIIRDLQRTSNQGLRMRRKKVRNENGAHGNIKDLTDFYGFLAAKRVKVSTQTPLKKFYGFKNHVQGIGGLLQHQGFVTHIELRSHDT